jgi:hypothetical protein
VSPTWKAPLLQARGADGSLIITSSSHLDLPPGAHSLLLIPPGSLKYGWSSDPAEYALPAPPRRDPGTPRRDVNAPRDPVTPRGQTASFTRAASSAAATRAFSAAAEPGASEESVNSVQTSDQSFAGPPPFPLGASQRDRGSFGPLQTCVVSVFVCLYLSPAGIDILVDLITLQE